ncbi:MAG: hypothetical protein MMC23_001648 [Stictis urceolatum]|nr:hypothetical protein [Stictis urceolata]
MLGLSTGLQASITPVQVWSDGQPYLPGPSGSILSSLTVPTTFLTLSVPGVLPSVPSLSPSYLNATSTGVPASASIISGGFPTSPELPTFEITYTPVPAPTLPGPIPASDTFTMMSTDFAVPAPSETEAPDDTACSDDSAETYPANTGEPSIFLGTITSASPSSSNIQMSMPASKPPVSASSDTASYSPYSCKNGNIGALCVSPITISSIHTPFSRVHPTLPPHGLPVPTRSATAPLGVCRGSHEPGALGNAGVLCSFRSVSLPTDSSSGRLTPSMHPNEPLAITAPRSDSRSVGNIKTVVFGQPN